MEPHYGLNMINQKITFPRDDNFSDDELAFLPYFVYFHALRVSDRGHAVHRVARSVGRTLLRESDTYYRCIEHIS